MSIQQAKTMRLNSTAGPLPAGATCIRFPLTAGSARGIQEAELNQIFDDDPAIPSAEIKFSAVDSGIAAALYDALPPTGKSWSREIARRRLAMAGTATRIVMARRPGAFLTLPRAHVLRFFHIRA
jgi:hypothetical protein